MLREEYDAIEMFKQHTENEGTWESIKKQYLKPDPSLLEAGISLELQSTHITKPLQALIKYRDLIDYRMYRQSVEAIFSQKCL